MSALGSGVERSATIEDARSRSRFAGIRGVKPALAMVRLLPMGNTVPLPSWAIQSLIAHRDSLGAPPLPSLLVFMSTEGTPVRT